MSARVFHITSPDGAALVTAGEDLHPPSLATEGFVHCSTAAQVVTSTARHFAADAMLVLLELDADSVAPDLTWPEVYPGQHYPHLHRALRPADVIAVHPWGPADRLAWKGSNQAGNPGRGAW